MDYEHAKLALGESIFADLRHVTETGSTNADLADSLRSGSPGSGVADGWAERVVVLVADHQTAGRGRLQRKWDAPPGSSVLMSIGMPLSMAGGSRVTLLPICVSLSVADAVAEMGIGGVDLKWPNDIVHVDPPDPATPSPHGYRKFGGVLSELVQGPDGRDHVVIGLGLNVNWGRIPDELADVAMSLDELADGPVDRWELITRILGRMEDRWLPALRSDALGQLLDAYRQRCVTIGSTVRVDLVDRELTGRAVDVTATGALVVDVDGVEHVVTTGDVIHLRPM